MAHPARAQSEAYVLACYRYIERNPVRAGMVRHSRNCRRTSYHANAGAKADPVIERRERYVALGRTAEMRGVAYRQLFRAHVDEVEIDAIRAATNGNYTLGNNRFEEEIGRMLKRRLSRGKPGRRGAGKRKTARENVVCP